MSHVPCCLVQAYRQYKKGKSLDIMDPSMGKSSAIEDEVSMCVQIGLLCTQSDPQLRPNMRRVVVMLSRKLGTLEEPTRPGYPGVRYRSRRKSTNTSATAGTSRESSHSFGSTNTNTTTNTSTVPSPKPDPHGKRLME